MRFCSLASGSNGNCHYVEGSGCRILIDAGLSGKRIEENMRGAGLEPASVEALFLTHEHIDHVAGAAVWARRYRIPVYATEGTWEGMGAARERIPAELIRVIGNESVTELGGLRVRTMPVCHDAADPVAYSVSDCGRVCSVVTDTGVMTEELLELLAEADLAVVESNHDLTMLMTGPYPPPLKRRVRGNLGHLSNEDCGETLAELLRVRSDARYLLGHLSEVNNTPSLALITSEKIVEERLGGCPEGRIYLTRRGEATGVFTI